VEQVDHPVVLVGPHAAAQHREGPVVVCVDGRTGDAELVAVGAAWARALGRTSYLATVAEPAPPSLRGPAHEHRARGPAEPEAHLAELRHDLDPEAGTEVVYDPVSVADGLRPLLARLAPSLVVVGTRRRRGVRRLVLGDHGAAVVHEAPAPVLVVPLGLRR
jgi:nucleotide-binding universal stress UspA family protein